MLVARKKIETKGWPTRLGEEGKGDVKVSFGYAGETNGQANLGRTVGHGITINYEAYSEVDKNLQRSGQPVLSESETENLDAGLAAHEATHALGNGLKGLFQGHFEEPAYLTESASYQGLHYNDRAFGLWNESWLAVDKDKVQQNVQQLRDQAIQKILHPKPEKSQP